MGRENFAETAERETKEETGLIIKAGKVLCVSHRILDRHGVGITFHSEIIGGTLSLEKKEITEAKWLAPEEITNMPKIEITHNAYSAAVSFKKGKQLVYSTIKRTAENLNFTE